MVTIEITKKRMLVSMLIVLAILTPIIYLQQLHFEAQDSNDGLNISGHFHLEARHSDGTVFFISDKDNIIVTNGFKGVSNLMFNANSGITPSTYRYLDLGSSSTAVSASDTALNSACGFSRQLTSSPSYSSGVTTLTGSFTGTACTVNEIGVFDASSSGNMISHALTGTVTLGTSDTMTATYTFTVS